MNTKVLEKIYKGNVELSEEKVELAKIDELQAIFKQGQSSIEKSNALSYDLGDAVTMWNKTFSALKKEMNLVEKNVADGYKLIDVLNKQAKDLGINEIPEVKKIEGYFGGLNKTLMALRGAVNDNKNRMDSSF